MIENIFQKLNSNIIFFKKNTIISYINVYNYLTLREFKKKIVQ